MSWCKKLARQLIMANEVILNASDITVPRRPHEFIEWVERKAKSLGASHEAKTYARSGAPLSNKFHDEIYPLALFVGHELVGNPDAIVTPNLGNDNFDATIFLGGCNGTIYIEVTQAKDGYDESRRLEVLTKEGSVSGTGPIVKTQGRRGAPDRIVEVQSEAVNHDDLLTQNLLLVETAVRAKANRVYGPRHVLLLAVDDYVPFREQSDHRALDALITQKLLSSDLDFSRLVVLGVSGKLYRSYQLPKYATRTSIKTTD